MTDARALQADELDTAYTHLCKTMTQIGEEKTPLFLARLALLALVRSGDAKTALGLIDAAAADIPAEASH